MDQKTVQILFALLRSACFETSLTDQEKAQFLPEQLSELIKLSKKHDIDHLLALGLKQNTLISHNDAALEKNILKAVFRCEQLEHECEDLFGAFEEAQIRFLPLKGAIMRRYYP